MLLHLPTHLVHVCYKYMLIFSLLGDWAPGSWDLIHWLLYTVTGGCHRATKQIRDPLQLVHPPTCLVHVCYVYVDFLKTGGLRTWLLGFDTLTLVFCHSVTNYIAVWFEHCVTLLSVSQGTHTNAGSLSTWYMQSQTSYLLGHPLLHRLHVCYTPMLIFSRLGDWVPSVVDLRHWAMNVVRVCH